MPAEVKEPETKPEAKDMSAEETQKMMEEMPAPEGYAKTAEEPPVEEEKPAEEKKPEEVERPAAEEKQPETVDTFEKLEGWAIEANEQGIEKEGQLKRFLKNKEKDSTPRERAYFAKMFNERKKRQRAEEERDQALFRETKAKETKPEEVNDPLKDRDDEDYMTVKDVRELLKKPVETKTEEKHNEKPAVAPQNLKYLQMCEKECRAAHPEDFDAVMELSDELITDSKEHLAEISERTAAGENPAEVMYELIKNDDNFETLYPAAEATI